MQDPKIQREHAALQHSKWEEQRLHPGVRDKVDEVKKGR
jgi:hypothetical protein